jgi:hypothetical protein
VKHSISGFARVGQWDLEFMDGRNEQQKTPLAQPLWGGMIASISSCDTYTVWLLGATMGVQRDAD